MRVQIPPQPPIKMKLTTTYFGQELDLEHPKPEDIDIWDIAHALSLLCRYGGHCREFYSVAEHCIHVSNYLFEHGPDDLVESAKCALTGLLHDGSEAYLVDIPTPLKSILSAYKDIEHKFEVVINKKFTPFATRYADKVKHADQVLLVTEAEAMATREGASWANYKTVKSADISFWYWTPSQVKQVFIDQFTILNRMLPNACKE